MALVISIGPDCTRFHAAASCGSVGGSSTLWHLGGRKVQIAIGSHASVEGLSSPCPCGFERVCSGAGWKTHYSRNYNPATLEEELVEEQLFCRPSPGLHFTTRAGLAMDYEKRFRVNQSLDHEESCKKLNVNSSRRGEGLYCSSIATEFGSAVQSGSPLSRQKQESLERDNYYVNIGYAIRTLRDELPDMFYKELTLDIYREDITFQDPLNTFSGVGNYKHMFWSLRFHGRMFFKAIWVDILRVWQPEDKVIKVRWTVRGIPRVPWESQGQFDGTSEYKLDRDGKIYAHKVDNIAFNSPFKLSRVTVLDFVQVAAGQTPTPSVCGRVALKFVQLLWGLTNTSGLNSAGKDEEGFECGL